MATTFGGSRLANLREKRTSGDENTFKKEENQKLSLAADESEGSSYQPSVSGFLNRTQTRLLKGRIDRPIVEKEPTKDEMLGNNENSYEPNTTIGLKKQLSLNGGQSEGLKLVLNDDPVAKEDKNVSVEKNPMRTTQKRIMIAKEPERERIVQKPVEEVKTQPLIQTPDPEPERPIVFDEEKPIKEEDVEQSMPGESDLVQCPQGCGRKFNRKALQKHAKACKLVFMSKRKEFNSEAKRLVNKEQGVITKQQKDKQKKQSRTKGKVFEKTSDNWKSASEDFRAAVKAIKKQVVQDEDDINQAQQKQEMKILTCNFCNKPFAEVFLEKHVQTCGKKKQADKKKTMKKK